jgi:dTMP kinase
MKLTSFGAPAAPLIVLEGIDGSGKGTQSALLAELLERQGLRAPLLSFPRYQSTFFGQRIGEFLDGQFGALDQLDPFLISLLYAGDRFESRQVLAQARAESDVVILDRYVPSNIAHQTSKLELPRREILREWIEHIEYEIFSLPRPDLVVLLDISLPDSQELISRKNRRSYTDRVADLQEADTAYLARVRDVYLELARQDGWRVIPVSQGTQLRSVEEISDEISRVVGETLNLAQQPPHP